MVSYSKKSVLPSLALLYLNILLVTFSCSNDSGEPIVRVEENEQPEEVEIAPADRLPLISIDTRSNTIVDEPKVDAQMTIAEKGANVYSGAIGIEFRGASSQQLFPKKSFGLETRDENNEDLKVSLLGFPEEEDWILYGPFSDKTLMRNMLIYDLSRDIGKYASRSRFVEVDINTVYMGVYVFMEKLKRDSERIDISKLDDDENSGEDLTGGYILKIDKTAGTNLGEGYNGQNSFISNYGPPDAINGQSIHFLYEYPDAEDITNEQKAYITNYMKGFEDALVSENFTDPNIGYDQFIDSSSFIDFFILTELANNVDGYRLSTFLYKSKNEKLNMGPIWDFNIAFGNADYCSGGETDVWAYRFNERCPEDFWQVPFWWDRLLQDPIFVTNLRERWVALRGDALSESKILSRIDAYSSDLTKAGAIKSNFETWPFLGTYVWPNNFIGQTHADEIGYLKNWISKRLRWMDGAIEDL